MDGFKYEDNSISNTTGVAVSGHGKVETIKVDIGRVPQTTGEAVEIDWGKVSNELAEIISLCQTTRDASIAKDENKLRSMAAKFGKESLAFLSAVSANTLGAIFAKFLGC